MMDLRGKINTLFWLVSYCMGLFVLDVGIDTYLGIASSNKNVWETRI